ncbi:hypothetical protein FQN57_003247 [Myotisia sp. PD_48]|nr:hypothetical protein FQN57_003247 [Myotisia sp. PD_48]
MSTEISCDADMPRCLNTPTKQAKKAKLLAEKFSGLSAKKSRRPDVQGFFSRTQIVTLQNGEDVVIQFRPDPLDLRAFTLAHDVLGPIVPKIELLPDDELQADGIWVYRMNCLPGKIWVHGMRGKGSQVIPTIARSLARIFSKGRIEDSSEDVIKKNLRPHMEMLLASSSENISPFKDTIRDLLSKLDQLKKLPLFVSHFDLNEVNILIDEDCEVSGIVDWELATPLPFGVGFGRIHTIAGEYSEGEFYMSGHFVEAEVGFWQELFDGVSADTRKILDANLDIIQLAVLIGTVVGTFPIVDGKVGIVNPVGLKALPKHLSYRIPAIRGSDPPYRV